MPIYEYRCPDCCTTTEVYHRMAERPRLRCDCGGRMEKQISLPTVFGDRLDWSSENGGLGRQVPMLQRGAHDNRPETYARSAEEVVAKCKAAYPECSAAVARD